MSTSYAEKWQEVLNNPVLHVLDDLPYRTELDKQGHIIMSPTAVSHGHLQSRILSFLNNALPQGEAFVECPISTPEGVKVPDVIWCSTKFIETYGLVTTYPKAPELCVEVLSPSNSSREMTEKTRLYLAQGAQEVWLVYPEKQAVLYISGLIKFYTIKGQQSHSTLVKALPPFLSQSL